MILIIIIVSFDIAPFPYKHAQRHITFHCPAERMIENIEIKYCRMRKLIQGAN